MQNLVIFSVNTVSLSGGPESPLIKFEDTVKTGEAVNILEYRVRIQNGCEKLEKLSGNHRMHFKRNLASVLYLGKNNQAQKCRIEEASR